MADPLSLAELIVRLGELERLRGTARALLARELSDVAAASLQAAGDEGVWQATREASYEAVAAEMGYSGRGPVTRAVTRHGKRATEGSQVRRSRVRKIAD